MSWIIFYLLAGAVTVVTLGGLCVMLVLHEIDRQDSHREAFESLRHQASFGKLARGSRPSGDQP